MSTIYQIRLFVTSCVALFFAVRMAEAQVGATSDQFQASFGAPIKQEAAPTNWVGNGVRRIYSWHGFRIVTDSISSSGSVMRVEYQKTDGGGIKPAEVKLLLKKNASRGCMWKTDGIFESYPTYRRSDGTTALLLTLSCKNALIVRSPGYTRQAEGSLKMRVAEIRKRTLAGVASNLEGRCNIVRN